jgi:hypothetical protein
MINFIFLKNFVITFDLKSHILTWTVYTLLFYISYSFLIPVFLFKKNYIYFVIGSLIIISGTYFINQTIAKNQFITVFKQMQVTPGRNFGPNGLKRPPIPPQFDKEDIKRPELEKMLQRRLPPNHGPGGLLPLYGLLLIYFASISVKVLLKLRDDELKREELMKERISTELLYLKQQVNPHFLFNTLNNIYSLSIKNPEIAPSAILKVSSILRYTLYKSNSLAFLRDEIEIINAFIDFQKMRFKNNLPITYDVSGEIGDYKIEPFILLPLIENAFKHGMINIDYSFITIQITINSGKLKFLVSNKKSDTNKIELEHSGIGLNNIKRLLDLVYPDCHDIKIVDKDDIFSVYLRLPLRT